MPTLRIDGREVEVPAGTKVIDAALQLGIVIPRFCYHPALGAVGACRVCAVKFEQGHGKSIDMSCMVDARDGMVVSTTHPEAQEFRRYVIEWLMLNHPHDCPVCDEGGQCLLQDETVSGNHCLRRYPGPKRTFPDQYLGPFLQHEMNRCIQCYRCSRMYREFMGYRDLGVMQIANKTYFGRFEDGPLESPFAGNLADICPTGVYTDKPARYKGRRWDFERTPSVCVHCSLGCATVASVRYRGLVRIEALYDEQVNGHFICDRGRFGPLFVSAPERPREARLNGYASGGRGVAPDPTGGSDSPRTPPIGGWDRERSGTAWPAEALPFVSPSSPPGPESFLAEALAGIERTHGPGAVACLGSGRSSLETMGMLKRLCRARDWPDPVFHLDTGVRDRVEAAVSLLDESVAVSLRGVEGADFLLAVGIDPVAEAPMLVPAMRQAVRTGAFAAVLDPRPMALPFDHVHVPAAPWELDGMLDRIDAGAACNLDEARRAAQAGTPEPPAGQGAEDGGFDVVHDVVHEALLVKIEARARRATRGVIVCGTDATSLSTVLRAGQLARSLGCRLFFALPAANDFGAALVGMGRHCFPEILDGIEAGTVRALVAVEADPLRHHPDRARVARALGRLDLLAVADFLPNQTASMAHVFLPSATHFEARASYVNQEGRVRTAGPAFAGGMPVAQAAAAAGAAHPPRTFSPAIPGGAPRPAWELLLDLSRSLLLSPGRGARDQGGPSSSWPAGGADGRGLAWAGATHPQGPAGPASLAGQAGATGPAAVAGTMGPGSPGTGVPEGIVLPPPVEPDPRTPAGQSAGLQPPSRAWAGAGPGLPPGQPMSQALAWLPGPDETPRLARLFAGGYPVPGGRALPRPGEAEAGPEPVCRPDPEPEAAPPDGWLRLLLVEWTFGTEAMSGHSAAIRQAEPAPRLLMHTVDAAEAGLAQAVRVVVDLPGGPVELDLAVTEDMARGVVVMPRHRLLEWQRLDSRASGGAARPLIPRSAIRRAGP